MRVIKGFRVWVSVLVGIWFFSYLALTRVAHWDSYLELRVASSKPVFAKMHIKTTNGYVTEPLFIGNIAPFRGDKHRAVIVKNLSPKPAGNESEKLTSLLMLKVDGKDVHLPSHVRPDGSHMKLNYLRIQPERKFHYRGKFNRADLRFALPRDAGESEIRVDGQHYLTFDYNTLFAGQTFDVPIGQHRRTQKRHRFRLPKTEMHEVVLEFFPGDATFDLSDLEFGIQKRDATQNKFIPFSVDIKDQYKIFDGAKLRIPKEMLKNNHRSHPYFTSAALCIALFVGIVIFELMGINFLRWFSRLDLTSTAIILFVSVPVIYTVVWCYPSIMQTDSMSTWAQIKYLDFNTWHSHFYSWFVFCFSLLDQSPGILTILQTGLMLVILNGLYLYLYYQGVSRWIISCLVGLNFFALPLFVYPAFFVRDVLYCLLTIGVFLAIAILFFEKHSGRPRQLPLRVYAYIGVTIGACFLLRAEGIYLLVAIPLILWWGVERCRKKSLVLVVAMVGIAYIGDKPLQRYMEAKVDNNYLLTLAIEPLGSIVNEHYLSDDYPRDREIIEKIIRFHDLRNHHRHLEAFWSGRHLKYGQYSKEDIDDFVWLTAHLAKLNPDKFLKNRTRVFFDAITSNTGDVNLIPALLYEGASRWGWHQFERDKYYLGIYETYLTSQYSYSRQVALGEKLSASLKREKSYFASPRTYIWSALWPILMMIAVLFAYAHFKVSALVSLLVLARAAMLFFFEPMSHFKYFFDVYLWAPVLIGLVCVEYCVNARARKKRAVDNSNSTPAACVAGVTPLATG